MSTPVVDGRLACGRDPVEVWDRAETGGLDDHERTCPHCQTVVAEHRAASASVRAWRDAPVEVPPALLGRVSTTVRAALASRRALPVPSPHGPVRLDAAVAASFVRADVDDLTEATARSCVIELVDPLGTAAGAGGGVARAEVRVRISVVAPWGRVLPAVARDVRRAVRTAAALRLGLTVTSVDVTVEDLAPAEPAGAGPVA